MKTFSGKKVKCPKCGYEKKLEIDPRGDQIICGNIVQKKGQLKNCLGIMELDKG